MAIDNKKFQIRIESILGGHAEVQYFPGKGQFTTSIGIDPGTPVSGSGVRPVSGLISPTGIGRTTGLGSKPIFWMVNNPKSTSMFLYDAGGSIYSTANGNSITGISDGGNESGSSTANGAAYYDNYMYFARNTTIARYGPLNGTPSLNGDYWGSTLGMTALTNTTYPQGPSSPTSYLMPNHILHRHSDGRLYVADVVDNRGTLHYISTSKTTVEGDTNNGSKFSALTFGYGLWPTAIETYGSSLAIALCEVNAATVLGGRQTKAKIGFWDTTSQNFNQITWNEFPDSLITSLKNVNGVLYVTSTNSNTTGGLRLSRYVGGYSFQEVRYLNDLKAPWPGATAGFGRRFFFGSSFTTFDAIDSGPVVFSLGLSGGISEESLFCISRGSTAASGDAVTALSVENQFGIDLEIPVICETNSAGTTNSLIRNGSDYGGLYSSTPRWRSQIFKVAQPFKLTKLRFPTPISGTGLNGSGITVNVYADDVWDSIPAPTSFNLGGQANGSRVVVWRPSNLTGKHDFFIEITWSGSTSAQTIGLPITIEGEYLED